MASSKEYLDFILEQLSELIIQNVKYKEGGEHQMLRIGEFSKLSHLPYTIKSIRNLTVLQNKVKIVRFLYVY